MDNPKEEYSKLSIETLVYAGCIPLALELLGYFLKVMKRTLEKLQRTPLEKIQNALRISFDTLDDDTKNIFLDIAYFFVGIYKDKDYIIQILDGCGFFPDFGIKTLTKRSLMTIGRENKFRMHGLIQDMRREIIHKSHPICNPLCQENVVGCGFTTMSYNFLINLVFLIYIMRVYIGLF
jgi:hypothetical protein